MNEPIIEIIEIIKSQTKKEDIMKTRHYHWTLRQRFYDEEHKIHEFNDISSGRAAIAYDEHWFKMDIVYGAAPPLQIIHDIVKSIDKTILERIKEKNERRKHPFRVHKRVGMSGCLDLQLYILKSIDLNILEKVANLHISMFDKLNQGIELPTMDLLAIYEYEILPNLGRYSLKDDLEIIFDEAEQVTFEDWHNEYNPQNNILTDLLPKVLGKVGCTYLYLKKDKAGREYVDCDYSPLSNQNFYVSGEFHVSDEVHWKSIPEGIYEAIISWEPEIKELLLKHNLVFNLTEENGHFYKIQRSSPLHAMK